MDYSVIITEGPIFFQRTKALFKKTPKPKQTPKVKTKGQKVSWLKLLLIRHSYPGLAVQAPCWHIQTYLILVAFKAFLLMQATSATVEKIKGTKGEIKKWILKKGIRYRKRQEMLVFQFLPVAKCLKFISTQLTFYKQKYISFHSIFEFSRGSNCCKQTVLGFSSIVCGECIQHTHERRKIEVKAGSSYTFKIYLLLPPVYSLPGIVPQLLSSIDSVQ